MSPTPKGRWGPIRSHSAPWGPCFHWVLLRWGSSFYGSCYAGSPATHQAKAKFTAGLAEISALKAGYEDTLNQGTVPTLALIGGTSPTANCKIEVTGDVATGAGDIRCEILDAPAPVLGKSIVLTRNATSGWSCTTTVEAKYAGKGCGAGGA